MTDAAILDALACRGTVADAAAAAGLSERTVHRRLEEPDFAEEVRRRTEAAATDFESSDAAGDGLGTTSAGEDVPHGSVSPAKRISARQLAANRRNALRSTGPRTPAGKARSSRNAVRHGAYARHLYQIDGGVFEEDGDELQARVDAIVRSLRPRNAVEAEQADRVALAYVRMSRLDRFEAAMLAGATTLSRRQRERLGDHERISQALVLAGQLGLVLVTAFDEPDSMEAPEASMFDWQALAMFIREQEPDRSVEVEGLWTDECTPATREEWRAAFGSLVALLWPDRRMALAWAEEVRLDLEELEEETRYRADAAAGSLALDQVLDRTVRLREHAQRELSLALATYSALEERPEPIGVVEVDDLELEP